MLSLDYVEVWDTNKSTEHIWSCSSTHVRRFTVNPMKSRLCVQERSKQITGLRPDMSDPIYRSWPECTHAELLCATLWHALASFPDESSLSLTPNAVFCRSFPTRRKTSMLWYRLTIIRLPTGTSTARCQRYWPCHKHILGNPASCQHRCAHAYALSHPIRDVSVVLLVV